MQFNSILIQFCVLQRFLSEYVEKSRQKGKKFADNMSHIIDQKALKSSLEILRALLIS